MNIALKIIFFLFCSLVSSQNWKEIAKGNALNISDDDSMVYRIRYAHYVDVYFNVKYNGEKHVSILYEIRRVAKWKFNYFKNEYIEKNKKNLYWKVDKREYDITDSTATKVQYILDVFFEDSIKVKENVYSDCKQNFTVYVEKYYNKALHQSVDISLCDSVINNLNIHGFRQIQDLDSIFSIEDNFISFFKKKYNGLYAAEQHLQYDHNKKRFLFRFNCFK